MPLEGRKSFTIILLSFLITSILPFSFIDLYDSQMVVALSSNSEDVRNHSWFTNGNDFMNSGKTEVNASGNNGRMKWKVDLGYRIWASPVIDEYGNSYVGNENGTFFSFSPTGVTRWNFTTQDGIMGTATVVNERIYFGSLDGYLYCLDTNGNLQWKFETSGWIDTSPVVKDDGSILFGSGDGFLYKLNEDGNEIWKYNAGGSIESNPAMDLEGNIYFGTNGKKILSLDSNGSKRWEFTTQSEVISSPLVINGSGIAIGSRDEYLYFLDFDGDLIWKKSLDGIIDSSPSIGYGGFLVSTFNGLIYNFSVNGSSEIVFQKDIHIKGSLSVSNDIWIHFGSYDGNLYSIDRVGKIRWTFKSGDRIPSTPAISQSGEVIFTSYDGFLYCIDQGVPNQPRNISARGHDGYIELKWDKPFNWERSEIQAFEVWRGESTNIMSMISVQNNTNLSYLDEELTNGDSYYYLVKATNRIGSSPPSIIRYAVSRKNPVVPSPPREVSLKSFGYYYQISWKEPLNDGGVDLDGYIVEKSQDNETFEEIFTGDSQVLLFNDTSVEVGQFYYYRVTARNSIGRSDSSLGINGRMITHPDPPINVTFRPDNRIISISWYPPSFTGGVPIIGYHIYRSENGENFTMISEPDPEQMNYSDTDLVNGREYFYYLTAVNEVGESDDTVVTMVVPEGRPSPPRNLSAGYGDGYSLLEWDPPQDDGGFQITHFKVYRGTSPRALVLTFFVETMDMRFNDTTVKNGFEYYYQVLAVNEINSSDPSNMVHSKPIGSPGPPVETRAKWFIGFIQVSWDPPKYNGGSPVVGYRIYRSNGYYNEMELIGEVGPSVTLFKDEEIEVGKNYYYEVSAINDLGESKSNPRDFVETEKGGDVNKFFLIVVPVLFIPMLVVLGITGILMIVKKKTGKDLQPERKVKKLKKESRGGNE